jgi:cysteine-rich repeat protein
MRRRAPSLPSLVLGLLLAAPLAACSSSSFEVAQGDLDAGVDATNVTPDGTSDASTDAPPVVADPCAGKPDGTKCSSLAGFLCVGGVCSPSRCGDRYVDLAASEECDDGNDDPNDGCHLCRWLCESDAECADGSTCNGVETCDLAEHVCKPGTPQPKGTTCTLPGGGAGVCNGPTCAKAGCGDGSLGMGEQCDDGNVVDGDGCDADCTWSCASNADCDDGDVCNGVETCDLGKHVCTKTAPLACDDGKSCTKDACDPKLGCQNVPIDEDGDGFSCEKDCNDGDPSVYVGAPELCDGKDNDCDGTKDEPPVVKAVCFPDADGDGFGVKGGAFEACICPTGTTVNAPDPADCSDGNASVHPKQSSSFGFPYCAEPSKDGGCARTSFDYDCSGVEEKKWTRLFPSSGCAVLSLTSCAGEGWQGSVPACGAEGTYVTCVRNALGCKPSEAKLRQECR